MKSGKTQVELGLKTECILEVAMINKNQQDNVRSQSLDQTQTIRLIIITILFYLFLFDQNQTHDS